MHIVYVDSEPALNNAIQSISTETYIAIDTEFRREDTYFPELCLIQIATQDTVFLIDVIKLSNIDSLFSILTNKNILKVFHSGRQDLEIFCHLMQGSIVQPIFDTQIAAMFAGYGECAGFETLVHKLLNVRLDKSSRDTNWTKRPLTDRQKLYAINDVLYLRPLYDSLVQKLKLKGRLTWINDEVKSLEDPSFLITPPSQAWKRLSTKNLSPRSFAIIQKLAEWREDRAQRMNTPRSWLLKDEVILNIAKRNIHAVDGLYKIPYFPEDDSLIGNEIWSLLESFTTFEEDELPSMELMPSLSKTQQNLLDILKLLLKIISEDLDINPKLIAEKETLIKWIYLKPNEKLNLTETGWRYDIFWKKAEDLIQGKLNIYVEKNRVKLGPLK